MQMHKDVDGIREVENVATFALSRQQALLIVIISTLF